VQTNIYILGLHSFNSLLIKPKCLLGLGGGAPARPPSEYAPDEYYSDVTAYEESFVLYGRNGVFYDTAGPVSKTAGVSVILRVIYSTGLCHVGSKCVKKG